MQRKTKVLTKILFNFGDGVMNVVKLWSDHHLWSTGMEYNLSGIGIGDITNWFIHFQMVQGIKISACTMSTNQWLLGIRNFYYLLRCSERLLIGGLGTSECNDEMKCDCDIHYRDIRNYV